MFSSLLVKSTFINSRFQLPDLDLYLDISIQIMGILMSGVLIQSNVSFRKKTRKNKVLMQFRYTDFKKTHHHKTKQEIPTQQAQNQPIKKSQNPNQQGVCVISGLDFFIIR